jgi:hypothetical protein
MASHPNLGLRVVASLVYSVGDQSRQSSHIHSLSDSDSKAVDLPLDIERKGHNPVETIDVDTAKEESWRKTRKAAL